MQWIWQHGVTDFYEMTNLSKDLRQWLDGDFQFHPIQEDTRQVSEDGTIKVRFKTHAGGLVESVLIPVIEDRRYTVCVSSQVGCSLSCTFCATGKMGLLQQLSAAEIYDQVVKMNVLSQAQYDQPITNIVFMGMGEPLLNYKQVRNAIHHITSPDGLGMSPKRITISTAGVAKMIRRLADDGLKVNLALSLHAATDQKRDKIMAINQTNSLPQLMDALSYYYRATKNRISYEYIALAGVNDSVQDARDLATLCQPFPVRVNIIQYNPIGDGQYQATTTRTINKFIQTLLDHGVTTTLRRSRGQDIDAACGQLANKIDTDT